jgi:hypothetical protein
MEGQLDGAAEGKIDLEWTLRPCASNERVELSTCQSHRGTSHVESPRVARQQWHQYCALFWSLRLIHLPSYSLFSLLQRSREQDWLNGRWLCELGPQTALDLVPTTIMFLERVTMTVLWERAVPLCITCMSDTKTKLKISFRLCMMSHACNHSYLRGS